MHGEWYATWKQKHCGHCVCFARMIALVNGMPHGSKNGKRLAKCSHKQPTLSLYYFGAFSKICGFLMKKGVWICCCDMGRFACIGAFSKICGFLMKKWVWVCCCDMGRFACSMHTQVPHVDGLLQIVLKETRLSLSLSLSLSLAMTIWCISRV